MNARNQAGRSPRAEAAGLLQLDPEQMREIGHRTIDALIDQIATETTAPVVRAPSVDELRSRLEAPPPEQGHPYAEVLERVFTDVTPFRGRPDAPGYMAFVPGFTTWPSAMADLIASALNLDSCWWAGGAGMTQLELTVLRWLADWIGYPADASGILTSGGSAANLTALGFRPERVRVLPVDRDFHARVDVLEKAIAADRAAGLKPLAVCANAGTTNTGAVDPFHELADVCARHDVWLHVDGTYGGFAVLTERGRATLSGIERADSVTLDPHKWLFQPFECGAVLVRERDGLRTAFEILPDYLRDIAAHTEVNFSDRGLQLTRMCRALKVWMSVQTFGLAAFRAAIDGALDLAREAAARVEASDELELLAPVELSVVALRRKPAGMSDERRIDAVNAALIGAVEASQDVYVSSTRLFGRQAVRLCILNPTTTAAHVHRALDIIERTPADALPIPAPTPPQRHPDVAVGWLARPTVSVSDLDGVPLFATAGAPDTGLLLKRARERRVHAGETLIEQWDTSREVFVILEGTFRVHDGERELATLGPGDLTGEMAALDWGAGYGAVRIAEVEARTPGRVLVLTPQDLSDLMARKPAAREVVERMARDRLAATQGD